MVCALTFDDGPDGRWTPQILDLLYDAEAHATFFVVGQRLYSDEAKRLILRMLDEGHEVGNHTWSHPHLSTMPTEKILFELSECSHDIESAAFIDRPEPLPPPTLWRAPYLDCPEIAVRCGQEYGMRHVGCDIITGDWNSSDPQLIAMAALSSLRDGSIVLLHDGIPPDGGSGTDSRQPTVDAVALLLETPGVTWCSVGEL